MESGVLDLLEKAVPVLHYVFEALGLIAVVIMVVIKATPSKADDAVLESIKSIPIVGGLLAALVGKAPVQEK